MSAKTNKGNIVIAKFMGGKEVDWFAENVIIMPYDHQKHLGFPKIMNRKNYSTWGNALILDSEIKYHSSWDWLMKAWFEYQRKMKVREDNFRFRNYLSASQNTFSICLCEDENILSCWHVLLESIQWYNKNKKEK